MIDVSSDKVIKERNAFKRDVIDLFLENNFGHMGHWEFSDPISNDDLVRGPEEWTNFLANNPAYYLITREVELAKKLGNTLLNKERFSTVVDIGPGSKSAVLNKSFSVIKNLKNVKKYIPIDFSYENLTSACEVAQEFKIKSDPKEGDILGELPVYQNIDINNMHLFMMWGGTINNIMGDPRKTIPKDKLVSRLKAIHRMMSANDVFIASFDCNEKVEEIEAAYAGQSNFAKTILHRINRDLKPKGDFDIDGFEFLVKFFQSSYSLAHIFKINRDMNFSIDGEQIYLCKGQKLYFNNSYKFSEDVFIPIYREAGFKTYHRPTRDGNNSISLHQLSPMHK